MVIMHDNSSQKNGPFMQQRKAVRLLSPFIFSMIIGALYAALIFNEKALIYINKILPSMDGPDLYQYLPVVFPAFVYSYAVQRKHMIWIENLCFSCIQAVIAVLSFAACLLVIMVMM
ncbi:hypothetical protein [Paenibacillus silvae]|nr:hypothetical protein [Paenibacillus silvae]MCK6076249.1 hypothetical protein [Paenibacillus silvae]MCK6150592.1 hypothetical protein [Paenibacillus silvae]MCK6268852.1 hypothetical protein [Paenibacillus silvae]MCK6270445.1 hypothetical protein [Paenibacillus silvae]